MTPLGAVLRGAVAGAAGTLAMDLVWFGRAKKSGSDQGFTQYEFSSGVTWETAPAPAQVGKRLAEGFLQREMPAEQAPLVNNVVHWATGLSWGVVYGLLMGSRSRRAGIGPGVVFGPLVCLTSYAVLPMAGLYKPIWEYDSATLAKDFSAHLAFGVGTAAAFRALTRGDNRT